MTLEYVRPSAAPGLPERAADPALNAHYLTILRFCMRQLGDRSDAEDATQETFRRALQQRDVVVGDPLPWLIAVARNICIDELRRRRSGQGVLQRSAAVTTATRADDESAENPERVVVGRMFVNELLGQLTPAERRVVAGTIADGRCGGDLAASLGVTTSTARVLLARARQKLRRYLEDGQTTVTGVCFAGWRGADWVRHRVLGGRAALLPRAELLLPALVVTAMVSAPGAPAAAAAGGAVVSSGTYAASALRLDIGGDTIARGGAASGAVASLPWSAGAGRPAGTTTPTAPQPRGGSPIDPLLPTPNPNQVWVSDFAPSPDYSSDHTIYMIGSGDCYMWCDQLFRSRDGGATWTNVPTQGLHSTQLLLPPSSYDAGRFYAAGFDLLQVTTDSGAHFREHDPITGYATVAPPWLGTQVVTSDLGLSFVGSSQVPTLVAAFGPAESAVSAPVLLPSPAGGFTALQLVQNDVTNDPDTLLRCAAGGCAALSQIPLAGTVQLLASPDFASDHTLVAVGGGVAVSHDGGSSFALVSTEPLSEAIMVPGQAGGRLLAVDLSHAQNADAALMYSDDQGRTWSPAGMDNASSGALYVHAPQQVRPGRLIASAADPRHPGMNVFICSADGGSWSACTPDLG